MTGTAERNRALKALLTKAFAGHKVTVRGSRGTAYGWVSVRIGYAPRDGEEARTLRKRIFELMAAAKIEVDTYGYDDPGSDYGYGSKIHIDFSPVG